MIGDSDPRISAMLGDAARAVRQAMEVCRAVQRRLESVRTVLKADQSPVTIADLASQAVVAQLLAPHLIQRPLVGEEDAGMLRAEAAAGEGALTEAVLQAVRGVWPEATAEALWAAIDRGAGDPLASGFWTLDPVDGTKGFLRGEQYAVSLAYVEGGQVRLGVLGCPNLGLEQGRSFSEPDPHGTLYLAAQGLGAVEAVGDAPQAPWRTLLRRDAPSLESLRLCESVEAAHSKHDSTRAVMEQVGARGSSARLDSQTKYAVVARGEADVYLRLPTKKGYVERIWDHAAGALIATEAGCAVSDARGRALDFSRGRGLEANAGVVVAPRAVHGALIEAIRAIGADGA